MVDFLKILENPILIKSLTGFVYSEFQKNLARYKRANRKKNIKALPTQEEQYIFCCIINNLNTSYSLLGKLLGKDQRRVHEYAKRLGCTIDKEKPRLKHLGEFFKRFPELKECVIQDSLELPFQLTDSDTKAEHKRLFKIAITQNERLSILMRFREEIINRDDELTLDEFIIKRYNEKYGEALGAMELKEMAYLWGVSIEYMTRVLNIALNSLKLESKELFERLIIGY